MSRCAYLRGGLFCCLALWWGWALPAWAASVEVGHDYDTKAAFLYNFAKFIQWPPRAFASADAPLVIGVLGSAPCEAALSRVIGHRKINGRVITVRRVESAHEASATQLLFVGAAAEARFEPMMATLGTVPVVTVGEGEAFSSMGGTIAFVQRGNNMRFEINTAATSHAGVRISAQLLKLATAVRGS